MIEAPHWGEENTAVRADRLYDTTGDRLDEQTHQECPGQVIWFETTWVQIHPVTGEPITGDEIDDLTEQEYDHLTEGRILIPVEGCADRETHRHRLIHELAPTRNAGGEHTTDAEAVISEDAAREAAAANRRLVIENNKAWDSATTVRRAHLRSLAARKTPPKGTGAFLARALCDHPHAIARTEGNALALDFLGLGEQPTCSHSRAPGTAAQTATEARATMIALIQVLAAYETDIGRHTWRTDNTDTEAGHYLTTLTTWGYTLSDVEDYATSDQTA